SDLYAVNGFNGALSDKIPLNRSLPDIRHYGCKAKMYIESLPTVSVVVPFHNEHWNFLKDKLDKHLAEHMPKVRVIRLARRSGLITARLAGAKEATGDVLLFLDSHTEANHLARHMHKVRVIRLARRSGLIKARLAGAKEATGDVLLFLDSHTEANVNCRLAEDISLQMDKCIPLKNYGNKSSSTWSRSTQPIALHYRTAVCPFIDVVAFDTFEYRAQDEGARGAFDWEFFYKRL
ncbi:N-acetyl galactosaminyl transferase 6, partial [Operophtera brumata]